MAHDSDTTEKTSPPEIPRFMDRADPRNCPRRKYVIWNTVCILWIFFSFVSFLGMGTTSYILSSGNDSRFVVVLSVVSGAACLVLIGPMALGLSYLGAMMESSALVLLGFFGGFFFQMQYTYRTVLRAFSDLDAGYAPSRRWLIGFRIYVAAYVLFIIAVVGWFGYVYWRGRLG